MSRAKGIDRYYIQLRSGIITASNFIPGRIWPLIFILLKFRLDTTIKYMFKINELFKRSQWSLSGQDGPDNSTMTSRSSICAFWYENKNSARTILEQAVRSDHLREANYKVMARFSLEIISDCPLWETSQSSKPKFCRELVCNIFYASLLCCAVLHFKEVWPSQASYTWSYNL